MGEFRIGSLVYETGRVMVIAELGTGHGGDLGKAAELIAAAIESGADCVKFQHVYADEIIHPATGLVPLPGGLTPLYERFRALETGVDFLAGIKERVEALGALFLCTPFGLRSARELRSIEVAAMKIASPELNYIQLLDEVSSYHLPTILSSGVSSMSDIEEALGAFGEPGPGLALLHCVTAYPAPETDYNLRVLGSMSALLGIAMGVSDHSLDPVLVPALAVASGACIVEKHFCLSRKDDGLDDPIALSPTDFSLMVQAIRAAEMDGPKSTIATLSADYGASRVESTLGNGVKHLAPSERANYRRTNRSMHASRPIARGDRFGVDNLAILRTEKILRPGLHPRHLALAMGRIAARDVPDGEGVEWEDIGGR